MTATAAGRIAQCAMAAAAWMPEAHAASRDRIGWRSGLSRALRSIESVVDSARIEPDCIAMLMPSTTG